MCTCLQVGSRCVHVLSVAVLLHFYLPLTCKSKKKSVIQIKSDFSLAPHSHCFIIVLYFFYSFLLISWILAKAFCFSLKGLLALKWGTATSDAAVGDSLWRETPFWWWAVWGRCCTTFRSLHSGDPAERRDKGKVNPEQGEKVTRPSAAAPQPHTLTHTQKDKNTGV